MTDRIRGIDANTIILGFTGSIGSGCTYIAEGLAKYYPTYEYHSLSNLLKQEAERQHIDDTSVGPSFSDLLLNCPVIHQTAER